MPKAGGRLPQGRRSSFAEGGKSKTWHAGVCLIVAVSDALAESELPKGRRVPQRADKTKKIESSTVGFRKNGQVEGTNSVI